jgi:hypothetical protein
MKRAKYLQDMDLAQDALIASKPNGLTLRELMDQTKRSYTAMQQATVRLLNAQRITVKRTTNKVNLYFAN